MAATWQILRDGGLPLVLPKSGAVPSPGELAAAVRAAIADAPTGRERDALAAFVGAWASHWPTTFAAQLDAEVLAWARRVADEDGDRFLKLRRIAIANLASVL